MAWLKKRKAKVEEIAKNVEIKSATNGALKLEDVVKIYGEGENEVKALRGVSLAFRKSEFVSILGPSGCGKTTMLNIIGGLDRYTSGDLKINGVSTKKYRDSDWDTYRNNSVGFVFQNYNLIPHQTILSNVELALTLSGVSKSDRRKRAEDVLEKVGLGGLGYKRPNQLSGGQMQRVAIARALINDPEIVLADEPTGALDTETSIQIMEILKEVSKERLVIMVTHNPELADKYSTRIIRLLDGEVTDDTNPLKEDEVEDCVTEVVQEPVVMQKKVKGKSHMKFITALALSLSNLRTKKGRTVLTSIAGSIGIIGIALVLAVSTGFSNYIHKLQADTLSVYPITVTEAVIDLTDFEKLSQKTDLDKFPKLQEVYTKLMFDNLANMLKSNKITSEYLSHIDTFTTAKNETAKSTPQGWAYCVQKGYGFDVNNFIYSKISISMPEQDAPQTNVKPVDSLVRMLEEMFNKNMSQTGMGISAEFVRSYIPTMTEMPDNRNLLESQYEIIDDGGRWAENADELMLVVDPTNSVTDLTLALLGYKTLAIKDILDAKVEFVGNDTYSFDEIKQKEFYYINNNTRYLHLDDNNYIEFAYNENNLPEQATPLKITGILRLKDGVQEGVLDTGIAYTNSLVKKILDDSTNSNIVNFINDTSNNYSSVNIYSYTDFTEESLKQLSLNPSATAKELKAIADGLYAYTNASTPSPVNNGLRDVAGDPTVNKISVYSYDYEAKEALKAHLDSWNEPYNEIIDNPESSLTQIEEAKKNLVHYSDSTAMLFSAMNMIVDGVKIVLICFTAISLVVSSIMIGIITYVSVVERTKEIGVLRSIGARKKDISRIFNAETFLIGLFAGILGVAITYLLSIPINLLVGSLIVGATSIASLQITDALVLIVVSFILTLIAGVVPARIAAKKDPVIALRSE